MFSRTLAVGAASEDFFGISYDQDGEKWEGFSLGYLTSLLDIIMKNPAFLNCTTSPSLVPFYSFKAYILFIPNKEYIAFMP